MWTKSGIKTEKDAAVFIENCDIVVDEMDMGMFRDIIDGAVRLHCDEIIFQGDGEPIRDPRFFERVTYARDRGLKVIFFTNGILLNKEHIKKIMELEISEIFCSLPAGSPQTYARINTMGSTATFQQIVGNLQSLRLMKESTGKSEPLLQMTHVIHALNYAELKQMAQLDAEIGADKVRFYLARLDENIRSLKLSASHIKTIKKSLQYVAPFLSHRNISLQDNIHFQLKHYHPPTGSWSGNTFLKTGCPVGWFFCLVLARGEVSMCCHLRVIDHLAARNFEQVWNSAEYDRVRAQAKHLRDNASVSLTNGRKLFDDYCQQCDTHQVILRIHQLLDHYGLTRFMK